MIRLQLMSMMKKLLFRIMRKFLLRKSSKRRLLFTRIKNKFKTRNLLLKRLRLKKHQSKLLRIKKNLLLSNS